METIKILHSADWHLSNRGTIAGRFILRDGMNLLLLERAKAIEGIVEYVEGNNVDLVVIAGDLFDHNDPQDIAVDIAVKAIERLVAVAPVIIVKGNHDGMKGSEVSSALASLKQRSGIWIFETPSNPLIPINDFHINLFALPYPKKPSPKSDPSLKDMSPEEVSVFVSRKTEETLLDFSSKIKPDLVNILVGHFTVTGSIYSKEQKVPLFDISVRKEFLEPFDLVCLGHLHEPQKYYSGTIARNGFGEQDMRVGFKVYDLAMGSSGKKICDIDERFIDLPARQYVTLSPEEFMNNGDINPETAVRVKGRIPKHQYDELVRKMRTLNHPFLKNALEIELETAGSNGIQDISEEPDVESALQMWAKGRDGMDKFIDRLVIKGKEIEGKMTEVRG